MYIYKENILKIVNGKNDIKVDDGNLNDWSYGLG